MGKREMVYWIIGLLVIGMCSWSRAEIPKEITFQGRLVDKDSNPIKQATNVLFTIYRAADGSIIWNNNNSPLSVAPDDEGIFTVILGATGQQELNLSNEKYEVGLKIDNEELSPRQPLTSAPSAFYAMRATTAVNADRAISLIEGDKEIRGNLIISGEVIEGSQKLSDKYALKSEVHSIVESNTLQTATDRSGGTNTTHSLIIDSNGDETTIVGGSLTVSGEVTEGAQKLSNKYALKSEIPSLAESDTLATVLQRNADASNFIGETKLGGNFTVSGDITEGTTKLSTKYALKTEIPSFSESDTLATVLQRNADASSFGGETKLGGNLTVSGDITEGTTKLSNKYALKSEIPSIAESDTLQTVTNRTGGTTTSHGLTIDSDGNETTTVGGNLAVGGEITEGTTKLSSKYALKSEIPSLAESDTLATVLQRGSDASGFGGETKLGGKLTVGGDISANAITLGGVTKSSWPSGGAGAETDTLISVLQRNADATSFIGETKLGGNLAVKNLTAFENIYEGFPHQKLSDKYALKTEIPTFIESDTLVTVLQRNSDASSFSGETKLGGNLTVSGDITEGTTKLSNKYALKSEIPSLSESDTLATVLQRNADASSFISEAKVGGSFRAGGDIYEGSPSRKLSDKYALKSEIPTFTESDTLVTVLQRNPNASSFGGQVNLGGYLTVSGDIVGNNINAGGEIFEGGQRLSSKYALKSEIPTLTESDTLLTVLQRNANASNFTGETKLGGNLKAAIGSFETTAATGFGVFGIASNTSAIYPDYNAGGYFIAKATYGRGVYGEGTGTFGTGVHGESPSYRGVFGGTDGERGKAVEGFARAAGNGVDPNFGGCFLTAGKVGRAVQGEAYNQGNYTNYGGHFTAKGNSGIGVYGATTGPAGYGVYGEALSFSGGYGGYFKGPLGVKIVGPLEVTGDITENAQKLSDKYALKTEIPTFTNTDTLATVLGRDADASSFTDLAKLGGRFRVAGQGAATPDYPMNQPTGTFVSTLQEGWGVLGVAENEKGRGIYGWSSYNGNNPASTYGGYFLADGISGHGIYGQASKMGDYTNYGGSFLAVGKFGRGVYGESTGAQGYGGYFKGPLGVKIEGPLEVTGNITAAAVTLGGVTRSSWPTAAPESDTLTTVLQRNADASNFTGETKLGGSFQAAGGTFKTDSGFAGLFVGLNGVAIEGPLRVTGTSNINASGQTYGLKSEGSIFGVYGTATGASGYGGYFKGPLGVKIEGPLEVTGAITQNGTGVLTQDAFVNTAGDNMTGTLSINSNTGAYGIKAEGTSDGGFFKAPGDSGKGIHGLVEGMFGSAVYGEADYEGANNATNISTNYGGYFISKGMLGSAVYGVAENNSSFAINRGGYFIAKGKFGRGVFGEATGDKGYGVYAKSTGYRALGVDGSAYATGNFNGGQSLDIAEWIKVSDTSISAGDIVIIDKNNPKSLRKSDSPNSTLVAGVISTDPNYLAGNIVENGEILTKEETEKKGYRMLALAGQVLCNASTENGPIEVGDFLTTSQTPGYAMKTVDPKIGTILGKALEVLPGGKGKIMVLATLQ